ncbi:MAG: hypothetical protein KBT11_05335, partial [Treponema sp.]|nr:hypothetical protein [Candidatus Treponema equifaecale]
SKENENSFETLKEESAFFASTVKWTEEIEKARLTAKINVLKGISNRQKLSTLVVSARTTRDIENNFPELKGFGSLDNTLLSASLKNTLNSFFDAVSSGENSDSFMKAESVYLLALFYYDLNKILPEYAAEKQAFDETLKKEQEAAAEKAKDSSEKNESAQETPKTVETKKFSFFTKYLYGEPFLNGIYYEIPVRLYFKKNYLDLNLQAVYEENSWKIDQLVIVSLERIDG